MGGAGLKGKGSTNSLMAAGFCPIWACRSTRDPKASTFEGFALRALVSILRAWRGYRPMACTRGPTGSRKRGSSTATNTASGKEMTVHNRLQRGAWCRPLSKCVCFLGGEGVGGVDGGGVWGGVGGGSCNQCSSCNPTDSKLPDFAKAWPITARARASPA